MRSAPPLRVLPSSLLLGVGGRGRQSTEQPHSARGAPGLWPVGAGAVGCGVELPLNARLALAVGDPPAPRASVFPPVGWGHWTARL